MTRRKAIIAQVYKSLRQPHSSKAMSLLILLAEAEGEEGYWHEVLLAFVKVGQSCKSYPSSLKKTQASLSCETN